MPLPFINLRPGYGTKQTATPRTIFRDGQVTGWRSGGVTISGDCSRDTGNTGALNDLRPGLLMGKISSVVNSLGVVGYYANSIIGATNAAAAAGATTITAAAAVVTEIARRFGATGTFNIVGPPAANGDAATETVTYSAASGTSITVTAITNPYVSGSLIMPTDGSEIIRTFIPPAYPFNVFGSDGVTAVDQYWPDVPIAGSITRAQILPVVPTDTGILNWLNGMIAAGGGGGIFIIDTEF